jgi:rhodanese-related sulfurtransferase
VLSPLAARKAEKLGYKNVRVFHAGMPAWKKGGNMVVSNVAGLENLKKADASYVLIDLRKSGDVEKAHIPKAVALPKDGIAAMKDQFPKYKKANIILYNQTGDLKSSESAFKDVTGWGYKMVSILSGGIEAWEKAGQKTAKGPAASKITYVRKLQPGEIEVAVFKALVEKPSEEMIVLDVRTDKETSESTLPKAKAISLDDLEARIAELPKDKTIVVHCSTGVRAEMAHNVLKKAGLKSKFVKAQVKFDKEQKGKYTITE